MPVPRISFDGSAPNSNVPVGSRELLDDMANIYFRTKQYVDWVRANLTPLTGDHVQIHTFAAFDADGTWSTRGRCSTTRRTRIIVMGTTASDDRHP